LTVRAYIAAHGAIVLGSGIVCDGFDPTCDIRVQTHVHLDHMDGFASSKGVGDIITTRVTRELLIKEFNADLRYRRNLLELAFDTPYRLPNDATLILKDAGHMAGSAQVMVVHSDGYRTGYSGDFAWPLDTVVQVDELVLDATYGSPQSIRNYTQAEADERFVEEALRRVKSGPVFVHAHRGTLQRAIGLLDDTTHLPLLGSNAQVRESVVYLRHGHIQAALIDQASPEGKAALASGRYIMFVGKGDPRRDLNPGEHKIVLSAYMARPTDPFLEFSEYSCRIALSNHADFQGTLEYVDAVGPSLVLTDASRSPHAETLATEISTRLGITATAAMPVTAHAWS
jgi:putative mRNA 3-end processing factor